MKPRTLLVKYNEDTNIRPIPARAEKTLQVYPALGLLYLAATLRQHGWPVEVLDAHVFDLYGAEFQKALQSADPDIIGFTSTTIGWPNVVEAARLAREACPRARIVVGGPHVQIFARECLSFPWIDLAVLGDGEATMLDIVERIDGGGSLEDIVGTCVRRDGIPWLNAPRPWTRDLDAIPFPAIDLVPWTRYHALTVERPFFTMITTRGCPFPCAYCSQVYAGDTIRYRSPENVLDEMELYIRRYGARELIMFDETFTVKKSRVMAICEGIRRRGLRVGFDVRTRVDCVDEEMLRALRGAGCRRIHFGIESGSPRILEAMNKGITLEQVRRVVTLARRIGFSARGYFMIGYLDEDEQSYRETLRLSQELPLDWASFSITTPLPHTTLYRQARERGFLGDDWWREYSLLQRGPDEFPHLVSAPGDEARLKRKLATAYTGFYLRPGYIARRLGALRSWHDVRDLFGGLQIILALGGH